MKIERHSISISWTIVYKKRKFHIDFRESDGHVAGLCNKDCWQVYKEINGVVEELPTFVFAAATPKERKQAQENLRLEEKLIRFCVENFGDSFRAEIKREVRKACGHMKNIKHIYN